MYRHLGYISVVSELLLAPTALLTQVPKMGTESLDASRVFHDRQAPIVSLHPCLHKCRFD